MFLGTGPSGGVPGKGRSRRKESSALLQYKGKTILIDITSFFNEQRRLLSTVPDAILITHGHRDATSGIAQLGRWLRGKNIDTPIPLYTHRETIARIKEKYKRLDFLSFHPLVPFRKTKLIGDIKVLPLSVFHALREKRYPTFGYKFFLPSGKKLVYISDTSGWSKKVQKEIKGVDIIILDGAMWGRPMFSHLDMKLITPEAKDWKVGRLIFTQIGKTAPPHEKLKSELKNLWPRAEPAFDGMKISL